MPVRMKDIARDLGVSVVTVSKALRNHSDISVATRERVFERMKELNYRPNLTARALVTGRTYIMGLVVPDLVRPFFAEFAKGLSGVLRAQDYSLVLASSEEDPELELRQIERLLAHHVGVLLIASCQGASANPPALAGQSTPCIYIDRCFDGVAANFVGTDDHLAGKLATEHLICIGRKRIAHLAGGDLSPAIDRRNGYLETLKKHKIAINPEFIKSCSHPDEHGDESAHAVMQGLLRLKPRPDAVFCYNDPTAMGAMKAVLEAGLRIPEDIAIIGCGNTLYSDFLRVPLSTIDQSCTRMGEEAGRLALTLAGCVKPAPPAQIRMKPRLIVRESTDATRRNPGPK